MSIFVYVFQSRILYMNNDLFISIEPNIEATDTQDVVYEDVSRNYKYAKYWSNNWRKVHGLPLRRKENNKFHVYLKPKLLTVEETNALRDMQEVLEWFAGEINGLHTSDK